MKNMQMLSQLSKISLFKWVMTITSLCKIMLTEKTLASSLFVSSIRHFLTPIVFTISFYIPLVLKTSHKFCSALDTYRSFSMTHSIQHCFTFLLSSIFLLFFLSSFCHNASIHQVSFLLTISSLFIYFSFARILFSSRNSSDIYY